MIARLILVGTVAVLGLTLPTRPQAEGWFTSARAWTIAQLAEWDTHRTREDGGCIVVGPSDFSRRDVAQVARQTVAAEFEPIPVAPDLECGIAYELNRMAEGLDIPPTSTTVAESPADFVPIPSGDSVEMVLAIELCRSAKGWEAEEILASRTDDRPGEIEAVDAIEALCGEDPEVFEPSTEDLATNAQAESLPVAARSSFALIEPLADLRPDIAEELNRLAEGIDVRPEDTGIRPSRIRTFEPIEVPADLGSGTAYALNRASEGLGIVPPEVRSPANTHPRAPRTERADHSQADRRIENAVRLTRDAAFAWVNLLTGPTPVEMTSR